MFEAQRWHNDPRFFSPMMVLDNGKHVFIGDFVTLENDTNAYGKVVKFATEVKFYVNVLLIEHTVIYTCTHTKKLTRKVQVTLLKMAINDGGPFKLEDLEKIVVEPNMIKEVHATTPFRRDNVVYKQRQLTNEVNCTHTHYRYNAINSLNRGHFGDDRN